MAGWCTCSVRYGCTAAVQQPDHTLQFLLCGIIFISHFFFSLAGLHSVRRQSVWSSRAEDLQGKWTTLRFVHLQSVPFCFTWGFWNTYLDLNHLNILCPDYGPGHDSWSASDRAQRLRRRSDPGRSGVSGRICRYFPGIIIL